MIASRGVVRHGSGESADGGGEWEAGSMVDAREGEAGGGEGGEAEGSEAKGWTDGHEAEGGGGERGAARQVAIESALLTATR